MCSGNSCIKVNKFIIIGLLTLLTVFFGYQAYTGLELDNKYGILLPNNAEAKEDYEKFKELFGQDGGTLVIAIETDSLYTEKNFQKWKVPEVLLRGDHKEIEKRGR